MVLSKIPNNKNKTVSTCMQSRILVQVEDKMMQKKSNCKHCFAPKYNKCKAGLLYQKQSKKCKQS